MKNHYILFLTKTISIILITLPLILQQALGGNDKTTEINTFPWLEDFNSVTPPALPSGWTSFVESTHASARVETTTLVNPVSPPNQLRYIPINDPNATLLFISPNMGMPLNRLRVSFYALGLNSTANVAQVGSYSVENGFTPIAGATLTSEHQYYEFNLNSYQGNDIQLAIKGISDPATGRPTYLDNLLIDTIPLAATVAVLPDSWEFEPVHYGEQSAEKIFTITNTGLGTLVVNPSDIFITGPDATDFTLNNLTQPVELEIDETATIGVVFTPELEGDKVASLMVKDFEVSLSGNSYNPNITSLPHHEDFNNATPPALPFGWTRFMETTSGQATVQTSNLMTPNSPPYHIRFGNFIDANANLILISPEIEFDLNLLRVGFYAKVNTAGATTMEVGTWEPDAANSFTPLSSVLLTTDYTYYFFEFEDYDGDAIHFAFRPVFDATYRWVTLDDFSLNYAPQIPILNITPDSYTFEPLQAGTQSAPQQFTLSNAGGDTLVIAPSEISITGPDADDYILENLVEEVQLAAGETAHISVTFAPDEVGVKQATLQVKNSEVPLDGEAFDATISDFPWQEDFAELGIGEIPFGWLRDSQNWGVSLTNNAGGQSPEMRFHFVPLQNGAFYLKSPQINSTGYDEFLFSFRHMVNNYEAPGIYTLKVVTIADDNEYLIHEWVDPDDMPAETYSTLLTAADHGIGSENLRIAFVFDGATVDINHWFIDDILLREVPQYYTATFVVVENSAEQEPVEDVIINLPGVARLFTDETGQASVTLEAGTYHTEIIKPGYEIQTADVDLTGDDVTLEFFLKDRIAQPYNLNVYTEDQPGSTAFLTWDLESTADEFRYDDGVAVNQLGYQQGTINSILGAAHHYYAELHEMAWMLTSEGGPHNQVKLWVIGLKEDGTPDRNQILYTAENVSNTDNEWNTYQFAHPVNTPNGFYIGVSYEGFVGLALDDGVGEPWEFMPGTHFGIFNITSSQSNFVDISDWDVNENFLIRAYGDNLGSLHFESPVNKDNQDQPVAITGNSLPEGLSAGEPKNKLRQTDKAFLGFNVYLNDMETPVAENITQQQYLLENLEPGEYTAGVQAVYTTGFSQIVTTSFIIDDAITPVFVLTFQVRDEDGAEIPDAVITLNGTEGDAGVYVFEDLEAGTYSYTVSRAGYFDFSDQVEITDQDVLVEVVLETDDTSVDELQPGQLVIFPNPARNRITISASETIKEVSMMNISGQVVATIHPNAESYEIDVSAITEGIYFLRILHTKGFTVKKVQVVR
jgi:hypothetical protein